MIYFALCEKILNVFYSVDNVLRFVVVQTGYIHYRCMVVFMSVDIGHLEGNLVCGFYNVVVGLALTMILLLMYSFYVFILCIYFIYELMLSIYSFYCCKKELCF